MALERGFSSKGAKAFFFTEETDYKDFVRMFVISDFFRNMTDKERLGEVFSMLEEYGAKDAVSKISLCVAMTKKEYDKEFGPYTFLGVDLHKTYRGMKSRPKFHRPVQGRRKSA